MIPTQDCRHCGRTQAASAAFCAACGLEFRPPRLDRETPPPVPSWELRASMQGRPAVRVLVALLAALIVAVPFYFADTGVAGWLFVDALVVGVVLGCVALEGGALTPSLRASGGWWLLAAVPVGFLMQACGWLWVQLLYGMEVVDTSDADSFELPGWLLVVSIVLVPAIFEELAFRGIFLRSAQIFLRPVPAHLLTAAVFAGIHFTPLMLPFHFTMGLALGALRAVSGSLWPPILMHAVNNALAIGLLPGSPDGS